MSFERPLLLLTLLAVAGLGGVFLLLLRRPARYPVRFTNLDVLAKVASESKWRRYAPPAAFLLALVLLGVALARPHVKTLVPNERATIVLVIDTSRSMQSQDVRPSRLAAAKTAARAFVDRVPKRPRLGVVVFSGDTQVAAPPTTDRDIVRASIDFIGPFSGYGGTAIGDAIVRAVEVGQRSVLGERTLAAAGTPPVDVGDLVSIVFLSDGRQNRGIVPPLEGAARAKAAGIPVYTIALGNPDARQESGGFGGFGGRNRSPDPATLRAIARITGGEFFEARTANSLKVAYERLGSRLGRTPGRTEVTYAFLAAAAALVLAAGVLSARWAVRLP